MADLIKKLGHCAERNMHRTEKQLFGKHAPSFKHTYSNSFSVFTSEADKKPLFTASCEGEYKIPLFKLLLIVLGIISAAMLLNAAAKTIAKHKQRKLLRKAARGNFCDCSDGEDLPF